MAIRLIIFCLAVQLQNEGCRVLCVRDGFTSGYSEKGDCICTENKSQYNKFITRSVDLGPRPHEPVARFQEPQNVKTKKSSYFDDYGLDY